MSYGGSVAAPEGRGLLQVTSKCLLWRQQQQEEGAEGKVYQVEVTCITLHAISKDPSSFPKPCLYCQVCDGRMSVERLRRKQKRDTLHKRKTKLPPYSARLCPSSSFHSYRSQRVGKMRMRTRRRRSTSCRRTQRVVSVCSCPVSMTCDNCSPHSALYSHVRRVVLLQYMCSFMSFLQHFCACRIRHLMHIYSRALSLPSSSESSLRGAFQGSLNEP